MKKAAKVFRLIGGIIALMVVVVSIRELSPTPLAAAALAILFGVGLTEVVTFKRPGLCLNIILLALCAVGFYLSWLISPTPMITLSTLSIGFVNSLICEMIVLLVNGKASGRKKTDAN